MRPRMAAGIVVLVLALGLLGSAAARGGAARAGEPRFTDRFFEETCAWQSTGENPYFPLLPGHALVLGGRTDEGVVRLRIEVTGETRVVDGVETRVVVETEKHDGEIVEISRNFFAVCDDTESVFYFGEEVDIYENGQLVNHDGSWLAGENGARPGIVMPGTALVGARYYQELAPDVALDRAEIMSVTDTLKTAAGTFTDVLRTRETTPLEPRASEIKRYARGVGIVQDAELTLLKVVAGNATE